MSWGGRGTGAVVRDPEWGQGQSPRYNGGAGGNQAGGTAYHQVTERTCPHQNQDADLWSLERQIRTVGGGHTFPSAACALTVLVDSGTLIQKLPQEGQEEATGPGKLEAAPREPRATRHPGPEQNTRSDLHIGGAGDPTVTASPTRHTGQTRSHSSLLRDTSPKTQV